MQENAQIKTQGKFPAATVSYSMVEIAIFSEIFELEASPVEGQSMQ